MFHLYCFGNLCADPPHHWHGHAIAEGFIAWAIGSGWLLPPESVVELELGGLSLCRLQSASSINTAML